MAEPAPQYLALPSGLLELCALLGAPRDSLRGPEQVRPGGDTDAGGAAGERGRAQRAPPGAHGAPGVRGVGKLRRGPAGPATSSLLGREQRLFSQPRWSREWQPAGGSRAFPSRPLWEHLSGDTAGVAPR